MGGIIGLTLPYLDHILYVLFLRPQDLSSQRAVQMIKQRQFRQVVVFLNQTKAERSNMIFHSILFFGITIIFTFFVVSSSSNLFGKGLALGIYLHLVIDQMSDLLSTKGLTHWFSKELLFLNQGSEKNKYLWAAGAILLLLLGLMA